MITALGVEALHRAELIAKQADIVAALSIDVLQGTPRAFEAGTAMVALLTVSCFCAVHSFFVCVCVCETEPLLALVLHC